MNLREEGTSHVEVLTPADSIASYAAMKGGNERQHVGSTATARKQPLISDERGRIQQVESPDRFS